VFGIGFAVSDFLDYGGVLATVSAFFLGLSLATLVFFNFEEDNPFVYLAGAVGVVAMGMKVISLFAHSPALDPCRNKLIPEIVSDSAFADMGVSQSYGLEPADSKIFQKLIGACALQSTMDQAQLVAKLQEEILPDETKFAMRVFGVEVPSVEDRCFTLFRAFKQSHPSVFPGDKYACLEQERSRWTW